MWVLEFGGLGVGKVRGLGVRGVELEALWIEGLRHWKLQSFGVAVRVYQLGIQGLRVLGLGML